MIAHCTDPQSQSIPEIAAPPCTQRSLTYYLSCGEHFAARKEASTKDAWKEFKARSGGSFTDNCLKILKQWEDNIPQSFQDELLNFPFPSYLPLTAVVNLLKVPVDALSGCLAQLRELVQEQGYLLSKDISAIAKLFHVKRKTCLIQEEVMTLDDWQLVAKTLKLNPESLAPIQQRAQQLALHETVFTAHAVQALSELGHDPLRVLPKPKKKFTERDLTAKVDEAVEPYKVEIAVLKKQIEELQRPERNELNGNGSSPDDCLIDNFSAMYAEEVGEVGHSPDAKSEVTLFESRERSIAQEKKAGNPDHFTPVYSNPTFTDDGTPPKNERHGYGKESTEAILEKCATETIYSSQEVKSPCMPSDYSREEGTQEVELIDAGSIKLSMVGAQAVTVKAQPLVDIFKTEEKSINSFVPPNLYQSNSDQNSFSHTKVKTQPSPKTGKGFGQSAKLKSHRSNHR